jgi:hypothetical protein
LGILLAAGWVRILSPSEIADRLAGGATDGGGHGLDLLASDRRDLPPRQRNMCQFSPDNGPPVFGQIGPLRQMTLEKLQAKTNVTIDVLKVR